MSSEEKLYSANYACEMWVQYWRTTSKDISFNNPIGACPECTGIGYLQNGRRFISAHDKATLYDGIKLYGSNTMKKVTQSPKCISNQLQKHYGLRLKGVKIKDLPRSFMEKLCMEQAMRK